MGSRLTGFSSCGSWALEHRLNSCGIRLSHSAACGIFPDQGSNSRPLHWQADSLPLSHWGSPVSLFFCKLSYIHEINFKFLRGNGYFLFCSWHLKTIPSFLKLLLIIFFKLEYHAALVSAIQQHESATCIYISPPSSASFYSPAFFLSLAAQSFYHILITWFPVLVAEHHVTWKHLRAKFQQLCVDSPLCGTLPGILAKTIDAELTSFTIPSHSFFLGVANILTYLYHCQHSKTGTQEVDESKSSSGQFCTLNLDRKLCLWKIIAISLEYYFT